MQHGIGRIRLMWEQQRFSLLALQVLLSLFPLSLPLLPPSLPPLFLFSPLLSLSLILLQWEVNRTLNTNQKFLISKVMLMVTTFTSFPLFLSFIILCSLLFLMTYNWLISFIFLFFFFQPWIGELRQEKPNIQKRTDPSCAPPLVPLPPPPPLSLSLSSSPFLSS